MEHQYIFTDERVRRHVHGADRERPVAGEDRALHRHILTELPSKSIHEFLADERRGALLDEGLLLILRHHHLRIHLEVGRRIDREGGEEPLAVSVTAAKPVGPRHRLDARLRLESIGVRNRQCEHDTRRIRRDEPPYAAKIGRGGDRRHHRLQRRKEKEREGDAGNGEDRALLVAAEIGENQRQIFHRDTPAAADASPDRRLGTALARMRSPFSRCNTVVARSAACASCVTMTIVFLNSLFRRCSRASTPSD